MAASTGSSLGQHVTQSGFYDEGSQSVHASVVADEVYGRDRPSHIVADLHRARRQEGRRPGSGQKKVLDELDKVVEDHPDQILSLGRAT